MNLGKKIEPMSMKRIAGTCEHVVVYEAKNVAIYPEGVLVSGILGRLQIIINQFDEPMFIFDPCNNTPAPSANTSYGAFFSSFKTYWRGKKDSPQAAQQEDSPATRRRRASLPSSGPSTQNIQKARGASERRDVGGKEKVDGTPDFSDFVLLKKLNNSLESSVPQNQSHPITPSRSLSPPPDLSRSKSPQGNKRLSSNSYAVSLRVSEIFSVHEQGGEPICGSKLVMTQCEAGELPDFYFLEGNISEFFRKLGIFTVLRPSEHNSNFYFSFQPVAPSPNLVSNSIENEEKEGREGEEEEKEEAEGSEKERDDDDGDDDDDNGDGDGHGGGDGHGDDDDDSDSEPIQKVDGGFSSMMRCMSKNVVASNQERSERNSERRNSLVLFEDVIPPRPPSPPTQPHSPSSPSPSSSSSSTPVLSQAPPLLPDSPLSLGPPRQKSRQRISGSSSVPSLTACPPSPLPPALSFAISGANQESPPRSASPPARFPYSSYFFPSLSAKSSPSPSLSPSPPSLSPSPSPSRSLRDSLKGEALIESFHIIKKKKPKESPVNRIRVRRLDELGEEEWDSFFDDEGRLRTCQQHVLKRIFSGGVVHEIRHIVWKFLLGFFPWKSTRKEREQIQVQKEKDYEVYKGQWTSITRRQLQRFEKFREILSRVKKDVVRTDRTLPYYAGNNNPNLNVLNNVLVTYCMYNFDLGYCQGMNDLLSPIVYIMDGREADSFWCFKGYMDVAHRNFEKSQKFIRDQLLELNCLLAHVDPVLSKHLTSLGAESMIFCFRWLICRFKREFNFFDTMRLWEVMWTNALTPNFHLFIALAILLNNRNSILSQASQLPEVLKICNDVEDNQDVEEILVMAEFIFEYWSIQVGNPRLH